MSEPTWQDPDELTAVRAGDVLAVMRSGLRVTGVAHHTNTRGAWCTEQGGVLARPGEPFQYLQRAASVDDPFTVIEAVLPAMLGERVTLIRLPGGWFDINRLEFAWMDGEPPLALAEVVVLSLGVRS